MGGTSGFFKGVELALKKLKKLSVWDIDHMPGLGSLYWAGVCRTGCIETEGTRVIWRVRQGL